MHTPGPGRTKDMEKKRSYSRSKHASQQEIALYIFGKRTKKKVTHLSWGRFSSLAPWLGTLCAGLLEQFAQIESKAQLFAEVSTSFWNTSGHGAKGRAAHAAKGLALLWALLAALSPASGQDRMESGHLRNSPIDRCEDLSHAHCWGELSFAVRVSNLDTYIRCTCVDLTQAHI